LYFVNIVSVAELYWLMAFASDNNIQLVEDLKGTVSRDGGWDKTIEWYIRPKLMVAGPFFCLKIRRP
jgi:hypothetical protein